MIEYPEDLLKEARKVAKGVQDEWNEFYAPTVKEIRLVAAAILAERMRCVAIVRRTGANYDSLGYAGLQPAFSDAAEHAIDTIIKGEDQ